MPAPRSRPPDQAAQDVQGAPADDPSSAARAHSQDPFGATGPWLWAIRRVWGRDDCVRCGARFEAGERVRWLPSGHRGDGYALTHVACALPEAEVGSAAARRQSPVGRGFAGGQDPTGAPARAPLLVAGGTPAVGPAIPPG